MSALSNHRQTLATLRQSLQQELEIARPEFSSGLAGALPLAFCRGALVEYLAEIGNGATTLALAAAREACREGGALAVVDRERKYYPPAAIPFGFNQDAILIRPQTRKDELWALHQTLRSPGVAAVLCWPDQLAERPFRGLQIAAEQGGAVGLFVRPSGVRGLPAWSDMQLLVEAMPSRTRRRLRVEVVRSRRGYEGASAILELNDETATLEISRDVPLVAELAAAANPPGASPA
jgi:protein ImuA